MRQVKQLLYGIFYLALWSAFIAGVYFWKKPAPSCFDGTQNQHEAGVDCGGPCARVCIPATIAPVEVADDPQMILLPSASSSSAPRASLVAEVRNRNADFGAAQLQYTFTVSDLTGTAIASFPGTSFIYPGEVKYLALPNVTLPASAAPASVRLAVSDPQWTPADRFPRPQLTIQTLSTAVANDNLVTQGVLVNQDKVDFQAVYLTAIFFDANGAVVGVSATELDNVVVGDSRDFALFHPPIPAAALDRTRVFATAFNPR